MSHFSVLVIGENVEEQLAPYHEFECTGVNDQYVKDVERDLEELRSIYLKSTECEEQSETFAEYVCGYCGYETVPFGQATDKEGANKYGYVLIDETGNVIKIVKRTNPNNKWDWWSIGGRWSGKLKLKPEVKPDEMSYGRVSFVNRNEPRKIGYVDSAKICDIDFDGMKSDIEKSCSDDWERFSTLDGDDKIIKAFEYGIKPTDTRESFISRNTKFSTYAVVMNNEWFARGDMGWFGLSDEKLSVDEWDKKFSELLSSLDPNTRITVVDCHI